jgi:hypothetical protein
MSYFVAVVCLVAGIVLLARELPAQNVAFVVVLIGGAEIALQYWDKFISWQPGVLFWPGAIILLRFAAQWALRSQRRHKIYGLMVLAATSAGAGALDYGMFRWVQGAGMRCGETAGLLLFLTPWLIQKRVRISAEARR